jgi:hypothetical protein
MPASFLTELDRANQLIMVSPQGLIAQTFYNLSKFSVIGISRDKGVQPKA